MTTGALMLDIEGTQLTEAETQKLSSPEVGGLILFARNYESLVQLRDLVQSIRDIREDIIIAVDQEGGRVQRFHVGFTPLPAMRKLGLAWQSDRLEAIDQAREIGWLLATELRDCDIDISFAPVLDLDLGSSTVIGDRAFSENPVAVAELAGALMSGMHEVGMAATGKHFPGHGFVSADSHLALPVDPREFSEILESDIKPFESLIQQGLDAVMPAHIKYEKVCSEPAGFSEFWLQKQLRQSLGFEGVIFSDDLSMEGAAFGTYAQRAEAALEAGCDMVLVCNQPAAAQEVIDYLRESQRPVSTRLEKMKAQPKKAINLGRLKKARELAQQLCEES